MITTTYKRLLLLAALPALMLASCSREEMDGGQGDSPDTQNGAIRFEIGFAPQGDPAVILSDSEGSQPKGEAPATRVATDTQFNSTWENGDEIGVYAVEHGTELAASGNYIHNVKLTYTKGKWEIEEDIYWPQDGTKLDFYAYHPYDREANNPTSMEFSVYTDQSATTGEKSNYNLSDQLMAKTTKADGYGKGETVPLSFTHALAMVQVNVSKSMIGNYPADMLKVWLNGCTAGGVLNLFTQSITPPSIAASPVKIKMYPCPNDDGGAPGIYAYRALVPARTIAKGTVLFSFEYDGNILLRSEPLKQPLSLVQSKAEKFDMTFPFTSATVSANVRLAELFTGEELKTITHLKVMGKMTAADFTTIRDKMPAIASLDLGAATVEGDAIPRDAFLAKTSLKDFVFPRKIKTIGNYAFNLCSGLTGSLTIPEGVTTIGNDAFNNCSGLTGSLTIPEGVTTIGNYAFNLCSGLTGSLTIPEGVTTISDYAFNRCSGLTGSLNIPQGVTTIGNYAFYGCSGLTGSLTIPEGVTTIGNFAFDGCRGFTGPLNIPAGVQTIAGNAFNACRGITSLTIPASITSIGIAAFGYCTELTEITSLILEPDKVEYNARIFYGITADNITLYVPAGKVASYQGLDTWKSFKIIQELPAQKTKNN